MKAKDETSALFGIDTGEKMPEDYIYSHKAWDSYMGQLWAGLLDYMHIGADGDVIEVAPGASVKIAMALSAIGFRGRLTVIDPAVAILAEVERSYRLLLPNAKIAFIPKTLKDAVPDLPLKPACILSNHPLDDMMLAAGIEAEQYNELFDWRCKDEDSCSASFKKIWDSIERDAQRLAKIKKNVVEEWICAFQTLKPHWCALSQYNSSALQQSDMFALNAHADNVLRILQEHYRQADHSRSKLQPIFNRHKNYNNPHIGGNILDAANWLVLDRP